MIHGFRISMSSIDQEGIVKELAGLLNREGISSMLGTVLFLSCSMTLGTLLDLTGALDKILEILSNFIYGATSLVIVT